MLFYKTILYDAKTELPNENDESCTRNQVRAAARKLQKSAEDFNVRLHGEAFFGFVKYDDEKAVIVSICMTAEQMTKYLPEFLSAIAVSGENIKTEEITYDELEDLLNLSHQGRFLEDDDEILEQFGLSFPHHRTNFGENMIEELPKRILYERVGRTLCAETLLPELDRIYLGHGKTAHPFGHPCHYMMLTVDEDDVRRTVNRALL